MPKEKYCIETSRSDDGSLFSRNAETFMVSVGALEEKRQKLQVYQTKNGNKSCYDFPPKTDEYTIVKATSKEEFEKAYYTFLRAVHQCNTNTGEYYLMKRTNGTLNGMAWYSAECEAKMGLQISFYDEPKDFTLSVEHIKTWQGVQHLRRAGNTTTAKKFQAFFKVVLSFLHDIDNYSENHRSLVQQYKTVVETEKSLIPIETNWMGDNTIAKEKIKSRILIIEKRLMEFDTDTPDDRMKLRGELEGLRFAMHCLE